VCVLFITHYHIITSDYSQLVLKVLYELQYCTKSHYHIIILSRVIVLYELQYCTTSHYHIITSDYSKLVRKILCSITITLSHYHIITSNCSQLVLKVLYELQYCTISHYHTIILSRVIVLYALQGCH